MEDYIYISAGISLVIALFTSLIISLGISRRRSFKKINKILKKAGKLKNPEQLTYAIAEIMEQNANQHEKLENNMGSINRNSIKSLNRVAYERYDATDDTGGQRSFSLAILDRENSGIILTNIYLSDRSYIYLRGIENGESNITLSEEEQKVLKNAIEGK
jgi:hypothetical protein